MNQDPNPNPSSNQTPAPDPVLAPAPAPDTLNTGDTKNATRKRVLLIAASVVVLALIGFGVYAAMQANTKKNNQAVIGNITRKESQKPAPTNKSDTITTALPNGKMAIYANTEANQNLIFLSSDKGMNYVNVSSKSIAQYLATIDKSIVTKLCGANGELAQIDTIIVATMSTNVRMVSYPEDTSCLHELSTMRNADVASRHSAVALIAQVNADVKEFYSTVIIK